MAKITGTSAKITYGGLEMDISIPSDFLNGYDYQEQRNELPLLGFREITVSMNVLDVNLSDEMLELIDKIVQIEQ